MDSNKEAWEERLKDDRADREGNDGAGPHTKKELPVAKA